MVFRDLALLSVNVIGSSSTFDVMRGVSVLRKQCMRITDLSKLWQKQGAPCFRLLTMTIQMYFYCCAMRAYLSAARNKYMLRAPATHNFFKAQQPQ
jgi:hypothetical protein